MLMQSPHQLAGNGGSTAHPLHGYTDAIAASARWTALVPTPMCPVHYLRHSTQALFHRAGYAACNRHTFQPHMLQKFARTSLRCSQQSLRPHDANSISCGSLSASINLAWLGSCDIRFSDTSRSEVLRSMTAAMVTAPLSPSELSVQQRVTWPHASLGPCQPRIILPLRYKWRSLLPAKASTSAEAPSPVRSLPASPAHGEDSERIHQGICVNRK